jgi:hypothetical protein
MMQLNQPHSKAFGVNVADMAHQAVGKKSFSDARYFGDDQERKNNKLLKNSRITHFLLHGRQTNVVSAARICLLDAASANK